MTEHRCASRTPGCYRCELGRLELEDYASSLMVTQRGVVHDPDCSFVGAVTSTSVRWTREERISTDRPCSRCLPEGLPDVEVLR